MKLYELFKYTKKEIVELEYLLEQGKRFGIEDKIQEAFFQFHPSLLKKEQQIPGFGEHEPWAIFHKHAAAQELIFHFIDRNFKNEFVNEFLINKQIWEESFKEFIIKNDFRNYSDKELDAKFCELVFEKFPEEELY